MTPQKIALAVVGALALSAPAAMAQQQEIPDTVDVSGGVTKLALSQKAKNKLRQAGVTASGRQFAIASGEIDPADGNPADLVHSGKLTFKAGSDKIGFKQLNLELGATSKLFGTTAGRVVTIANVTGGTAARQGLYSTDVNGLTATLTKAAAKALNQALETHKFKKGLVLGQLSVDAQVTEALIDATGSTSVELDPAALQKLGQAQVAPSVTAPATLGDSDADGLPEVVFPIVGGTMKLDQSEANVLHDGGLLLSKTKADGTTAQIPLLQPAVEIKTPPVLTVNLGGARAAAADLDLSGMTTAGTANGLNIAGVVVKLNAAAAALLNATFETPNHFAAGDVIGTGSTSLTFK